MPSRSWRRLGRQLASKNECIWPPRLFSLDHALKLKCPRSFVIRTRGGRTITFSPDHVCARCVCLARDRREFLASCFRGGVRGSCEANVASRLLRTQRLVKWAHTFITGMGLVSTQKLGSESAHVPCSGEHCSHWGRCHFNGPAARLGWIGTITLTLPR